MYKKVIFFSFYLVGAFCNIFLNSVCVLGRGFGGGLEFGKRDTLVFQHFIRLSMIPMYGGESMKISTSDLWPSR